MKKKNHFKKFSYKKSKDTSRKNLLFKNVCNELKTLNEVA